MSTLPDLVQSRHCERGRRVRGEAGRPRPYQRALEGVSVRTLADAVALCQRLVDALNADRGDGVFPLRVPRLVEVPRGSLGRGVHGQHQIRYASLDADAEQWIELTHLTVALVVHELCHSLVWQAEGSTGHGSDFKRWLTRTSALCCQLYGRAPTALPPLPRVGTTIATTVRVGHGRGKRAVEFDVIATVTRRVSPEWVHAQVLLPGPLARHATGPLRLHRAHPWVPSTAVLAKRAIEQYATPSTKGAPR